MPDIPAAIDIIPIMAIIIIIHMGIMILLIGITATVIMVGGITGDSHGEMKYIGERSVRYGSV